MPGNILEECRCQSVSIWVFYFYFRFSHCLGHMFGPYIIWNLFTTLGFGLDKWQHNYVQWEWMSELIANITVVYRGFSRVSIYAVGQETCVAGTIRISAGFWVDTIVGWYWIIDITNLMIVHHTPWSQEWARNILWLWLIDGKLIIGHHTPWSLEWAQNTVCIKTLI
jgi:hypothetical protein